MRQQLEGLAAAGGKQRECPAIEPHDNVTAAFKNMSNPFAMAVAAVAENDIARLNRNTFVRLSAVNVCQFIKITIHIG
jgi:hypothetical protein